MAVTEHDELQKLVLDLTESEPITGKVMDGEGRTEALREILAEFFTDGLSLEEVYQEIQSNLSRHGSPHAHDKRVFPTGWDERLGRTQISRFYNEAVLRQLRDQGNEEVFIPHSDHEDRDSPCTLQLAGSTAEIELLLNRLHRAYRKGEYHDELMIPEHPHCTHTVTPNKERFRPDP